MFPLVFLTVIALDQLTKHLVRGGMALGESIPAEGFLRLVHIQNTGAAFGILDDARPWLIAVSSIALVIIIWLAISRRIGFLDNIWGRLTLGFIAGGTLGNLIDRAYYGYVTDFLKAGIWPAFNIADASMVIGMTILVFLYLRSEYPRSQ
ncbi:signal peptidase II [Dehalogenimonas sp. THU2]|uniref:signal peptidase II n=1 Tax=Dehalogenimonas sp. THU2 TaxID=3151121 RepID=UPI003218B6C5